MSKFSLFELQCQVLEYLTQPHRFQEPIDTAQLHPLFPINNYRQLQHVAELALLKRMRKIYALIPQTVTLLQSSLDWNHLLLQFAKRYPANCAGKFENTEQFCLFLRELWKREEPPLIFLSDVLDTEFSFACVYRLLTETSLGIIPQFHIGENISVRQSPTSRLLHLSYDIRQILSGGFKGAKSVSKCDIILVISVGVGDSLPRVKEITQDVYELLLLCQDWISVNVESLATATIFQRLVECGILEFAS